MRDIDGNSLPPELWHGTEASVLPERLSSAKEFQGWWKTMDHDAYLAANDDEDDPDFIMELDHEKRTSYGNIVFEALLSSEDQNVRSLAQNAGLEKLGEEVAILFATTSKDYAGRFGSVVSIDLDAPGILAAIPDDNALVGQSWILVLKADSPFPSDGSLQSFRPR